MTETRALARKRGAACCQVRTAVLALLAVPLLSSITPPTLALPPDLVELVGVERQPIIEAYSDVGEVQVHAVLPAPWWNLRMPDVLRDAMVQSVPEPKAPGIAKIETTYCWQSKADDSWTCNSFSEERYLLIEECSALSPGVKLDPRLTLDDLRHAAEAISAAFPLIDKSCMLPQFSQNLCLLDNLEYNEAGEVEASFREDLASWAIIRLASSCPENDLCFEVAGCKFIIS